MEAQFVPPSTHRRNRAERAIRDWKSHFISGLDSVDKDFLMYLWCELIPQAELTINHLRPYHLDPSISTYEGIFGRKFDFLAHPIHPPGTKVLVLDPVTTRQSWAPHGLLAFYLGPALQHHRSYRTYIVSTHGFRVSDSLSWHPEKLRLPGSSKEDIIFLQRKKFSMSSLPMIFLIMLRSHNFLPTCTLSSKNFPPRNLVQNRGWLTQLP